MEIKISTAGTQVLEFNVPLPCGANASIAPVTTLNLIQRWAKVINTAVTGAASYTQVTKFDVVYNIQYTDCKGTPKIVTKTTSTIMESPATSTTITTIKPTVTKVIDIIIPNGVSIVNQAELNESVPTKGNCAYSVFDVRIPTTTPSA